jgi:hypothetical protein
MRTRGSLLSIALRCMGLERDLMLDHMNFKKIHESGIGIKPQRKVESPRPVCNTQNTSEPRINISDLPR